MKIKYYCEIVSNNKEIASFIRNLLDLNDFAKAKNMYENIDVIFAQKDLEAKKLINFYRKNRGYTFIGYTKSRYNSNSIDKFTGDLNTHEVIGQEFDKVIIMMDNNFRYNNEGILQGRVHPNPDYIFAKLFYQGVSRAWEKLCIVVIENFKLFSEILSIKLRNVDGFER